MKSTPKPIPAPQTPTVASYASRGQSREGMGQRPNKLRPITGSRSSLTGRTSLLGGV